MCFDKNTLVVVEVRARATNRFGDVRGAVDVRKARKIIHLTSLLLHECNPEMLCPIRFDVILLFIEGSSVADFHHVRDAFDALI